MTISGYIVDIDNKQIVKGIVEINNGLIQRIAPADQVEDQFILPGFIDAHVHIESSMLVPSEFARLAVVHGTVGTVSDPHEIGNVMGVEGVEYMIENGKKVPFKFYFGAPSCVPATIFETAGANISPDDVRQLLEKPEIVYLAEMMNWPGVLSKDPEVMEKIAIARELGKPVDGHAPGLRGEQARQYVAAGMSTDHECFSKEEALDKLAHGMKILIREGSAAKNFEALIDLLHDYEDEMMFCSDDKHPDNLEEGHIDQLVRRAIARGIDVFKVLKAACINPVLHYGLNIGLLRKGDPADFIVVNNLKDFRVMKTYVEGQLVADRGKSLINSVTNPIINQFNTTIKKPQDFEIEINGDSIRAIVAEDGQLITAEKLETIKTNSSKVISDTEKDLLKIAVINRYEDGAPAVAFVKNFGLKRGAIASSVGHDSHNILVVGVDDESMARAVNLIIQARGGVSAVSGDEEMIVELPVAGIMSPHNGYDVAKSYKAIDRMAKDMGSTLTSPFMTLSFMALLVIPSLKLSDKGLFNGDEFKFVDLFYEAPE